MDDLVESIRRRIRQAVDEGLGHGPLHVASVINIGSDSRVTAVWSDDEKTVVQRDGRTTVIRHDEPPEPG